MKFEELNLTMPLLRAVAEQGYESPTPIQAQAIPHVLAGRDLMGCARTGTGKTAAFALPILQRLGNGPAAPRGHRPIRVLALAPTRELAAQIGQCFADYGAHTPFRQTVIFGGVGQEPQTRALRTGVDILIATPGRLLDLMGQGHVRLGSVEVLVLDEADRMLDMGFIHDIRRVIAALPKQRQTLLFSATLQPEILALAEGILDRPVTVSVSPPASTVEAIEQRVMFVERADKVALLARLLARPEATRTLVFCRTKHGSDKLVRMLDRCGVAAAAIHGNKSQNNRERALAGFKQGSLRVLVATDIAARGLDIDAVSHVVNFDLPVEPEAYVHRIGRTGRAGAVGSAISFCSSEERPLLAAIERLIRQRIRVDADQPFHAAQAVSARPAAPPAPEPSRRPADARPPFRRRTFRPRPGSDRNHG